MIRTLICAVVAVGICAAQVTYKVRLTSNEGNRIIDVSSEKYVAGVLAGECSVFKSDEGLKAMAVAARTFAARQRGRHAAEGFDFCATTHCQRFTISTVTPRLIAAAQASAGELLWSKGRLAFSTYSRDCGGETESATVVWPELDAAYLSVHPDAYCRRSNGTNWPWAMQASIIADALRQSGLQAPPHLRSISILARTSSGRASVLLLEGDAQAVRLSASSLRFAIGRSLGWNTIRSDFYDIENAGDQIIFRGRGEGHGVGLCQHGADEMGIEGHSYREILAFYYPGTKVSLTGTGLEWTRLGGEGIAVFTTRPDRDARILAIAEGSYRNLANRFPDLRLPDVKIRVYPDVETFRNATGEPGWASAHTGGSWIDLQPSDKLEVAGALDDTIRHELLHVVVDTGAVPNLPVWFREGLVECLAKPERNSAVIEPANDNDVQQRLDRARAEQAYRNSKERVAWLITHYGEDTVLGWLKRGLPAEVKNSSASSAATNNK